MEIKIGVLALQGDVEEHILSFKRSIDSLGLSGDSSVFALRDSDDIEGCSAIAVPGGESTTISRLIDKNGMRDGLKNFRGGFFATCAGMVVLASSVDDERVEPLGLIDISVGRNAFGRQRESFEADIDISGLNSPFHAVFIRAPVVMSAGPGADILSKNEYGAVAVKQGMHMAFSFHPELTDDFRLHEMFIKNLILK